MKFAQFPALVLSLQWLGVTPSFANPHWDPALVPVDPPQGPVSFFMEQVNPKTLRNSGFEVLKVQVDWIEAGEQYKVSSTKSEYSGTAALINRSKKRDPLGSYQARIVDLKTGLPLAYDSVGTGREFRKLTRAMTFRFPMPKEDVKFEFVAEHPETGQMQHVLTQVMSRSAVEPSKKLLQPLDVRLLKKADVLPALYLNIYAEGYLSHRKDFFWQSANKVVEVLRGANFPGFDRFEIHAVFGPSQLELGKAQNLGLPVKERDSFLGFYHPYWDNFGRWFHVVYPTRELKFRDAIGQVPYDYNIVLVDSGEYWGVGNYKELTAIPANHSSFRYLLLHEFGHYFGLNEEYEGGGRTELEFAYKLSEPWSPNITFLKTTGWTGPLLKWTSFVAPGTPVPTPSSYWSTGKYGAYQGGYADSPVENGHSHKPGHHCVMHSQANFCPICTSALRVITERDALGR